MDKLHCALFLALLILLASCDEKKEPVVQPNFRISSIEGDVDNYSQSFEYNKKGLVSRWKENFYSKDSGNIGIEASYQYSDDNRVVVISSDERLTSWTRRVFSDTLYLNVDGIAECAKGSVDFYETHNNYELLIQHKTYNVDFQFDSLNQLTQINVSEHRTDDLAGMPINWCAELEWKDGNMETYSEYYTSPYRRLKGKTTYSYYGGNVVEYKPIVQNIIHYFYLPLQYQGVFGKQSDDVVKRTTEIETDLNGKEIYRHTYDYAYSLSTSLHDSRVEAYSIISNFTPDEQNNTIRWEWE